MHSDKIGCFPNGCFDQLKKVNEVLFTLREVDIISCVLNMRGSSKIASILEISSKTVEAHIVNIKRKIDRNAREGIIDFIERSGKGYLEIVEFNNKVYTIVIKPIWQWLRINFDCNPIF